MASLTGNLVAETYKALLKTIDNDILTASEKQITDGLGGGSNVFIDSNGFLRANKYKVTNGLATQFLKADGSLDANTYLTSITGAQVITALGFTPVTNARTLTINGTTYDLTANRSWTVAGTAAVWGNITGTLSNQTDLQTALNAKFNNPTGTISQYIRGDGSIATFPTSGGGGGGGVSYYLNGSINQGTIGGVTYYEMNKVPIIGTGTDFSRNSNGYIASFLTDANDPALLQIPAGNWNFETYLQASNGGGSPSFYIELYKYDGTTFTLIASNSGTPKLINDGANIEAYFSALAVPQTTLTLTDRLAIRIYVNTAGRTITLHTENGHLCEVATTFSTGISALNGLTAQIQYLATGTSGTDFNISSSTATHTFNLPTASAVNRGALSAADWTTFNAKQAQLDGTGFVKASGTTISYDNSTYLTTADAASTYQRLDKLASSLFASATNYPNNNAVIAGLALKADAANPIFTGSMNIVGLESRINFYDENSLRKYFIGYNSGQLSIYQDAGSATRFYINSSGETFIPGTLTVGSVIKDGGTATQFLKADGSIDSSSYVTSATLSNYLLITTAASTYQRLDRMAINLLASDIQYPNNNAVIAALELKANAANPVFTGNMTISGAEPKLFFTDTDNNPDYTVFIDSGVFFIYDQTAGATRFSISSTGNISSGVGKSITAGSFVKESGLATQFLKADGSIDSSTYVTSTALADYLLITTAASTYQRLDRIASSLFASATNYPNNNAVIAGLALKADAANPVFTGSMNIQGLESRINFYDENNLRKFFIGYSSGQLSIYQDAGSATRFVINSSGNITTGVNNTITSWGFIRSGGTSSEFLKADGSVDSNAYALTSALGNYLPLTGGSLSGALGGTNANFSAEIQSASYIQSKLGASATIGLGSRFQWDNALTGSNQRQIAVQMNASNGLDFWFYNGSNYTNTGLKFNSDGSINAASATFTGALSGTSASFAGGVQGITATILGTSNGSPVLTLGTAGSINAVINTADEMFFNIDSNNNQTDARFVFGTNRSTSSGGIELVTFAENGNVLIGTSTNSGYKLDVNGSGRFSGILYASDNIRIYGANQFWFNSAFRGQIVNYGAYAGTTDWSPFFTSETSLAFGVNGNATKALNIATTGAATFSNNVTIEGNASTIRNGNELRFNRPDNAIYTRMYDAGSLAANGFTFDNMNSEGFHFKNNGSTIMRMPSNGNVGIGTTSPDRRLRVASDGSNWISGVFGGSGGTDQVVIGNYNGKASIGGHSSALNAWAALSLNFDGGNVLIGTTTDSGFKLDVNGGLRIQGSNPSITTDSTTDYTIINARKNGTRTWQIDSVSGNFWLYMQGAGNYGLQISGSTGAASFLNTVTATSFFESSDFRLKTLINNNPIIHGIEHLQAKLYEKDGKIELGYFAQDAEVFMPYAVTKNADGFLNLSYREVHTAKIARLEQRVAELEKQLNLN